MIENQQKHMAYRKLGILRNIRILLLLLLYWGLVISGWAVYCRLTKVPLLDPTCFIWTLLLILPPLALRVPYKLFSLPWTGIILEAVQVPDKDKNAAARRCPSSARTAVQQDISMLRIRQDKGKRVEFFMNGPAAALIDGYYHQKDRVRKYWGLTYPVNLSHTEEDVFCPVCGTFHTPGTRKCTHCRMGLVQ